FFNAESPEHIVFTLNATHALNIAIKSIMHQGGHAVVSGYEHNSVIRPLEAMKCENVRYTVAHGELFDADSAYNAVIDSLESDTRCIIINHVSNVFGFVQPLEKIDKLCCEKQIPLIIDASQSAGVIKIDVSALKSVAFVCMPGHKALYGPQGTGVLICCKDEELYSIMQGGTGSNSLMLTQPDFLPDIFESGTLNTHGIAGLCEGVKFVTEQGLENIQEHEKVLLADMAEILGNINGVKVYYSTANHIGPISFTWDRIGNEELCDELSENGFCLRSGLHCSPMAHKSAGTLPCGTIRASFGMFNDRNQVKTFGKIVNNLLSSKTV
ncbi:MAG: aminotransferase class V-fold PLP-dependent enzyme, partial [Angelakisella sp.]